MSRGFFPAFLLTESKMKSVILFFLVSCAFIQMRHAGSHISAAGDVPSRLTSHFTVVTGSPAVGVFAGRTPCGSLLRELHGISAAGCERIKLQLTLHRDSATLSPTTFQLKTLYVGKGDDYHTVTGEWAVTRGTKTDPDAAVYRLDRDKPRGSLLLLKADDNILLFMDRGESLMVGNADLSYTLNRVNK